ncbi:MAG: amidase domain-containing protein [Rhodoglobus sp.]
MTSPYAFRRLGLSAVVLGVVAGVTALVVILSPLASSPSSNQLEQASAEVAAVPEVSSVSALAGSLSGGESIVISGIALHSVSEVTFGGVPAAAVTLSDSGSLTVTVPASTDYQPATVAVEVIADSTAVPSATTLEYTYEASTAVDRQMQYLMAHWDDYNVADFGDLNSVGGDCANFASQSLLERGWTMTDEWYNYDAGADWSGAWGYVPSFENWLLENPQLGATQLTFDERSQVKVGDLVVFDWNDNDYLDHIQVVSSVTTVNGVITIEMVGHNLDTNYRDLDETITVDHPGATGHFWSIP